MIKKVAKTANYVYSSSDFKILTVFVGGSILSADTHGRHSGRRDSSVKQRISEQRIAAVRECMPAYLQDRGVSDLRRKFRCLSASHIDKHPSMSYKADLQIVKCFSCGYTRNIIGLYADEHEFDEKKDFQRIIEALEEKYLGRSESHLFCTSHPYLTGRGLSDRTIQYFRVLEHDTYQLGEMNLGPCITIPYSFCENPYVIVRLTNQKKFFKPAGQSEPIFHEEWLLQNEPVVIVESAICAMSVWQAGYHSIALNGTGLSRLKIFLSQHKESLPMLVLCLDQDKEGQNAQQILHTFLEEQMIRHQQVIGLFGQKDPNDLLCTKDGEDRLRQIIQDALDVKNELPRSVASILNERLYQWLDAEKNALFFSGIEGLDQKLGGLSARFYMIGGTPSVGKTSFLLQLAITFAKQRKHVLYLSYESGESDLIYKALSMISTEIDAPFAYSDIRKIDKSQIEPAVDALSVIASYLHIDDSCPGKDQIEKLLKAFDEPPVLLIDYLQIMPVGKGRQSNKEKIDELMDWLYRYTKNNRIPTFAISSFNRNSYHGSSGLDAFKESGSIEYSSDIVFTLQLRAFSEDKIFQSDYHLAERKKRIEEECQRDVRKMELVCQKNRYGEAWFKIPLDFHVKYSLFLESNIKETRRKSYQRKS